MQRNRGNLANFDANEELKQDDSWEHEKERIVPTYSFPRMSFLSVEWKGCTNTIMPIREDSMMNISRLKKVFDQKDRILASASTECIVYVSPKCGFRVIEQSSGKHQQMFKNTQDRIFNISLSTTATYGEPTSDQAVLAIGLSGTIYWAAIPASENNDFGSIEIEDEGLIFLPLSSAETDTSTSQSHTRAKPSSQHPEFFAVGRNNVAYVVFPRLAANSAAYLIDEARRVVDTERFAGERGLKITTDRAIKDFAFSEDDTAFATLERTGKISYWDTTCAVDKSGIIPELKAIFAFAPHSGDGKVSPSSIMFLDKLEPYQRSCAQRFLLVGFNQNHVLQLWDIALGKLVQELKLPQDDPKDPICSVAYYPVLGIIVVGHPTKNVFYFVQVSVPRYDLGMMSQSEFLNLVNMGDPKITTPNTTAYMRSLRELSFGTKGVIRSLELLPLSKTATEEDRASEDHDLFDLYVMHSSGVTALTISRADLGWNYKNQPIETVKSDEEGLIETSKILPPPASSASRSPSVQAERPVNGASSNTEKSSTRSKKRNSNQTNRAAESVNNPKQDKEESPSHKKSDDSFNTKRSATLSSSEAREQQPPPQVPSSKHAPAPVFNAQNHANSAASSKERRSPITTFNFGVPSQLLNKETQNIERAFAEEVAKSISGSLGEGEKQDLISKLLAKPAVDSLAQDLERTVSNSIKNELLPNVTSTVKSVIGENVKKSLDSAAFSSVVNKAVASSLRDSNFSDALSNRISSSLSKTIENEIFRTLKGSFLPGLQEVLTTFMEKAEIANEQRSAAQMKVYEAHRKADNDKIDKLTELVRSMGVVVSDVAQGQKDISDKIKAQDVASIPIPQPISFAPTPPKHGPKAKPEAPAQAMPPKPDSSQGRRRKPSPTPAAPSKDTQKEISELLKGKKYEDAISMVRIYMYMVPFAKSNQ